MDLREITDRSINEKVNAFIFSRDLTTGKIIYTSSNFEKKFDRSLKDYISNPGSFVSFVHPEDLESVKSNHQALMQKGVPKDEEFRIILPDGNAKWVWSRVYLANDHDLTEPILVGIIEDITNKKQVSERTTSNGKYNTGILNEAVHDIRTPFNSILGLTEIMETELKNGCAIDEYIDLIKKNCQYSLDMLEGLQTLAEVQGLKAEEIEVERIKISQVIDLVNTLFRERALINGIKFNVVCKLEEEHLIKANETLLVRAIANLISNAIKFTPKEGEIKLIISKLDDQLSIEVKDTGIGIPEELCPYIFHKFSGAKRVGLNQEKANGLGLHITKKLIELHHGTISFSSKEGHGSSFNILLPAEPLAYK